MEDGTIIVHESVIDAGSWGFLIAADSYNSHLKFPRVSEEAISKVETLRKYGSQSRIQVGIEDVVGFKFMTTSCD